jgi:hypothetical protein
MFLTSGALALPRDRGRGNLTSTGIATMLRTGDLRTGTGEIGDYAART